MELINRGPIHWLLGTRVLLLHNSLLMNVFLVEKIADQKIVAWTHVWLTDGC